AAEPTLTEACAFCRRRHVHRRQIRQIRSCALGNQEPSVLVEDADVQDAPDLAHLGKAYLDGPCSSFEYLIGEGLLIPLHQGLEEHLFPFEGRFHDLLLEGKLDDYRDNGDHEKCY